MYVKYIKKIRLSEIRPLVDYISFFKAALIFLLFGSGLNPCYSQAMRGVITVPYTTVDSADFNSINVGVPIVSVSVNGYPAKFMLDTGTTDTVITDDFASRAGLTGGKNVKSIADASGNKVVGQVFDNVAINLGITTINSSVYSVNNSDFSVLARSPVDGVLGLTVIEAAAILLSPSLHTLTFYRPGSLSQQNREKIGMGNAVAVPLTRNRLGLLSTVVTFKQNGKTVSENLTVDTGSEMTTVSDDTLSAEKGETASKQIDISALGSRNKAAVFTVEQATLGQLTVNNPTIACIESKNSPFPSLLGRSILSRYQILIDTLAMTMYLLPADTPIPVQKNGTMPMDLGGNLPK